MDLLGHDGEDLHVDPVELVEAGPGPGLGQALQELAHGVVVDPVRAVEHHILLTNGLGQVLLKFEIRNYCFRSVHMFPPHVSNGKTNDFTA